MPAPTWHQVTITAGPRQLATAVASELERAAGTGLLDTWWYLRKTDWRIRFRCHPDAYNIIVDRLDNLTCHQAITAWRPGVYEPEVLAFGGPAAMDLAHRLFHIDSTHQLSRAPDGTSAASIGAREVSAMLCGLLLRSAGLDHYEQADVWGKVVHERPPDLAAPAVHHRADREPLAQKMTTLLTTDPHSLCQPGRPLAGHQAWPAGFERAGRALATLNNQGQLERGLRAILAHHIIFHANRAGLTASELATMAALVVANTLGMDAVTAAATRPAASQRALVSER